jgi:asparagine synthase (glutamine-hydrolysing)
VVGYKLGCSEMCGISGVLAFHNNNFEVTASYLARMRDTMAHRGPDGAGLWISTDRKLGLAHRRLSILDLSDAASQPMLFRGGSLAVVFNGEIYNQAAIRRELEELGHRDWQTDHSDTEVILHAYAQWGIACLEKFRGIFAIALWDGAARELWLIRDRIGVKPLYYSVHHGRITFASEIKALLEDADQRRVVHEDAFFHYLSFITTPAPDTMFAGIRKLSPGSWLRIGLDGDLREHRYWDVLDHTTPLTGMEEEEIAERLLAELRTSVALRTVSDVPVGIFLSGGIDSSTNAALFSQTASERVKTFSVGYDRDYQGCASELPLARQMAGLLAADHHEQILSQQDFLQFLPRMVYLQDEPIADPVCMPVYFLSRLARRHGVVVAQAGEGSDELFWGYERWKQVRELGRWNAYAPGALRKLGLLGLRAAGKSRSSEYELLWRAAEGYPLFWGGAYAFTGEARRALLSPRLRRQYDKQTSWDVLQPIHERFQKHAWETGPVKWMSYLDLNLRLPELLLMRLDKMGMGASLEARVPFLDHRFVELAMSVPEKAITGGNESKHILKKAVRGVIPGEVIHRRKQGFGVPVHEWFMSELGAFARKELEEFCRQTDYLDWTEVSRLLHSGRGREGWFLLNFALWWKLFIAGETAGFERGAEPLAMVQ